jgi:hypothetical protein
MHVVIVGACLAHVQRGLRVINHAWLVLASVLLLFMLVNLVQTTDVLSAAIGERVVAKLMLCVICAVGAAGMAARSNDFAERFASITSTTILLVGAGLFYYSFVILGDTFINVSPSFVEGSSENRNQSSFAFAFAAVMAFGLFFHRPTPWSLARALALGALMTVGGSRGAVIAGSASILFCVMLQLREYRVRGYVLVIVLIAYAARGYVPDGISARFVRLSAGNAVGAVDRGDRDELFQITFTKALPAAPLLGHGTGTSFEIIGRYYSLGRRIDPHSDVNLLAIEAGLTGLVLYAALCAVLLSKTLASYSQWGTKRSGMLLTFLPLSALSMLHGLSETQIDLVQLWMVYGITFAIVHRLGPGLPPSRAVRLTTRPLSTARG